MRAGLFYGTVVLWKLAVNGEGREDLVLELIMVTEDTPNQFTPTPLKSNPNNRDKMPEQLKKKSFEIKTAPLILIVYGFVIAAYWFLPVLIWGISYEVSPRVSYKILSKDFATFTVEVVYKDLALKNKFRENEDTLSDYALKKVSAAVESKFGNNIHFSRFGKPYSFKSNPLNLAITFQIDQCPSNTRPLCMVTLFERTEYLFIYNYPDDSFMQRVHQEWVWRGIEQSASPTRFHEPEIAGRGKAAGFENLNEFKKQIDFLSSAIIEDMEPNEEDAAEAEEKLREEIKNNRLPKIGNIPR